MRTINELEKIVLGTGRPTEDTVSEFGRYLVETRR